MHYITGTNVHASSLHFDLTNLINPIKWISEPFRHIVGAFKDYNKNIWIGKRSLGEWGIGFSLIPGYEAYHYAIMIDGVVYQIDVSKKDFWLQANISSDKWVIGSFQWYPITGRNHRSKNQLKEFAINYEKQFVYRVVPTDEIEANCQTFVKDMLKYAANMGNGKALLTSKLDLGTIFN
jgi:hypothetical protein